MASRLKEKYLNEVVPGLQEQFKYTNVMAIPKLDKVVINIGLGEAVANPKALDAALKMLLQAVREAPAADQAEQLKDGAKRLLKAAAGLDLPGEDINKQLELIRKTVPAARATEE